MLNVFVNRNYCFHAKNVNYFSIEPLPYPLSVLSIVIDKKNNVSLCLIVKRCPFLFSLFT